MINKLILLFIIATISLQAGNLLVPDGQYEICSILGGGSNGTVFLAKDADGRKVALKQAHCREDFQTALPKEQLDLIFRPDGMSVWAAQEFATSQMLHHKSIMKIEKLFTARAENGKVYTYLVMEYIDGQSLRGIPRKTHSRKQAIENVQHFLSALKHAFSHHLMHADLYSDNVMFDTEGKIKIIDIGSFSELEVGEKIQEQTHKRHLNDLIFISLEILQCADFDESELEHIQAKLHEIAKLDKFVHELPHKIKETSCSYFISFIDELNLYFTKSYAHSTSRTK